MGRGKRGKEERKGKGRKVSERGKTEAFYISYYQLR